MKYAILIFAMLAAAGLAALEPVKEYTPIEMGAAYALLEAEGTPQTMETTLTTTLDAQLKEAPELLPFKAIFEDYLRRSISYEAQKEELARLYLETYTLDELKALTEFYLTPLGKKRAQSGAAVAAGITRITQRKMKENLPRFQEKMRQEMEKQQQ